MNKFMVFPCVKPSSEVEEYSDYEGYVVPLVYTIEQSIALFFPVTEDNAKLINYVLSGKGTYNADLHILGVYKTMMDSWAGTEKFLSGIIMDTVVDAETNEDVLMIRLSLSDNETGEIDSLVYVNFVHAIIIAAMNKMAIIISDKLMDKLLPAGEIEEHRGSANKKDFPEDKKLINIVKDIMSSNVHDDKKHEEKCEKHEEHHEDKQEKKHRKNKKHKEDGENKRDKHDKEDDSL